MAVNSAKPGVKLLAEDWERIYWKKDNQDPYFHLKDYHKTIDKYYNLMFKEGEIGRVFVPLCGKTVDLLFFEEKGHEVVGLEFSEVAIEAFFNENGLSFTKREMEGYPFLVYKARDKNITIYQGDFFQIKQEICGQFDAIWDRGGFVAINEEDRMKYSDLIFTFMKPNTQYLLQSLDYNATKFAGPPHYVTDEELNRTVGRKCEIKLLEWYPASSPSYAEVTDLNWMIRISLLSLKQ